MHYTANNTAKYVAKPEKPGFIHNNVSERERHALQRTQIHFLNGRVVGMPRRRYMYTSARGASTCVRAWVLLTIVYV